MNLYASDNQCSLFALKVRVYCCCGRQMRRPRPPMSGQVHNNLNTFITTWFAQFDCRWFQVYNLIEHIVVIT